METAARLGMPALVKVIGEVFDLHLEADDGNVPTLPMATQMDGEQVGRCQNVGVVEEHDLAARGGYSGVARRRSSAKRPRQMTHVSSVALQAREIRRGAVGGVRVTDEQFVLRRGEALLQ